jgi:hypothetical protein
MGLRLPSSPREKTRYFLPLPTHPAATTGRWQPKTAGARYVPDTLTPCLTPGCPDTTTDALLGACVVTQTGQEKPKFFA